jgi:hypothetical protein
MVKGCCRVTTPEIGAAASLFGGILNEIRLVSKRGDGYTYA